MRKSYETPEDSLQQQSRLHHLNQFFISKIFKSQIFFQNLVLYSFLIGFGFGLGFILNSHIRNVSFDPQLFPLSSLSPSPSISPPPEKCVSLVAATDNDDEGQKSNSLVETEENVMHNMTEEKLMFRASKSIQVTNLNMTKKVAFMFLARGKLPLAKLWEKFFQGHQGLFSIYIHTSDSNYTDDGIPETSPFYRRRIPSKEVEWGMVSMVEAERRLLANALLNVGNHRFVLLSESDIPLFNFSTIYSYLINSHQSSYVDLYDLPGPAGRGRYNRRMSPVISRRDWRKGSQWFEINREVALAVVSDTTYFPMFKKHCRGSCYADEHYFATFVHLKFPGKNANRSLTWTDWSRRGPHPRKYTRRFVTAELLWRLRNREGCVYNGKKSEKCYLFARKFDDGSLDRLIHFADKVMGF